MKLTESGMRLNDAVFCALDIETTGINPLSERIIEIGAIKFTLDSVIEEFSTLINPGRKIPEEAIQIHNISDDMVISSPVIGKVLPGLSAFLGKNPLVIQNPHFDISFLEMEYRRNGIKNHQFISYDTVELSKKSFHGLENYRLKTICTHLNVKCTFHRALSDAFGCMQVFREIIRLNDPENNWTFRELNSFYGKKLNISIREVDYKDCKGIRIKPGTRYSIDYVDSSGIKTERQIIPKKIFKQGRHTIIHAFCMLRNDERFFKAGRITRITQA